MDGGGTELNWLYGVTTTDVLVKVNKNIEQLSTESTAIVHALEVHTSLINESVWEIEASAQVISKLRVPATRLAGVAMERLALALFPPTQLGLVLTEVNGNLPTGLSLVSQFQMRDMWSAYQSARVVAAAVEGGIRLFIHFPVFEFRLSFSVYRVISLPRVMENVTRAIRYSPLPEYMAVALDRQTFLKLSEKEGQTFISVNNFICPVKQSIGRTLKKSAP
ncbi:hypothetical protein OUZ56_033559 [Daphnia magna]|uniref:Uncharacterized protein n=1 Tax=Daphnia magna TaxID=35525 RepID=A0ABR0BAT7_9CRUS|nr:hypothetical protein OUZ56_033559 [Daphnia magna]